MRVLCIHGQGSSGEIMQSQIANLTTHLPSTYEYDFLDSPLESAGAIELQDVYPGPYYCFFPRYTEEDMKIAVAYVEEVVREDGPFDLVVGFSQGASVAAAYISHQKTAQFPFHHPPFKLALFICAALIPPQTSTTKNEIIKSIGSLGKIDIPTIHVIGNKDLCMEQSLELVKCCDERNVQVVVGAGGHDIPRDEGTVGRIALGVDRAMGRALFG